MTLISTHPTDSSADFTRAGHDKTDDAAAVDRDLPLYQGADVNLSALVAWQESIAAAFGLLTSQHLDLGHGFSPDDDDAMTTSWSSAATGKPQLSYAERLRRAKENSGLATELSSNEPSTASEPPTPLETSFVTQSNGTNKAAAQTNTSARRDSLQTSAGKPDALDGGAPPPVVAVKTDATMSNDQSVVASVDKTPTQAPKSPQGNIWEARKRQLDSKAKAAQPIAAQRIDADGEDAHSPAPRTGVESGASPLLPSPAATVPVTAVADRGATLPSTKKDVAQQDVSAKPPLPVVSSWLKPLIAKKQEATAPVAGRPSKADSRRPPSQSVSKAVPGLSATDAAGRRSSSNPETRNPRSRLLQDKPDQERATQTAETQRASQGSAKSRADGADPSSLAVEQGQTASGDAAAASKRSPAVQRSRDLAYNGVRSPRGTRGRGGSKRGDDVVARQEEGATLHNNDSATSPADEKSAGSSGVPQQKAARAGAPQPSKSRSPMRPIAGLRIPHSPYEPRAHAPLAYPFGPYMAMPMGMPLHSQPAAPGFPMPMPFGMPFPESTPDEFTPNGTSTETEPTRTLLLQIEFYFSHNNLQGDFFLRKSMDGLGFVPIDVVATFNRVKRLAGSDNVDLITRTLQFSRVLQLSDDKAKVRKAYGWEPYVLIGGEHAQQQQPPPPPPQQHFLHASPMNGASLPHYFYGHAPMPMFAPQHSQQPGQAADVGGQQSPAHQVERPTSSVIGDERAEDDDDEDDDDDESPQGVVAAAGLAQS